MMMNEQNRPIESTSGWLPALQLTRPCAIQASTRYAKLALSTSSGHYRIGGRRESMAPAPIGTWSTLSSTIPTANRIARKPGIWKFDACGLTDLIRIPITDLGESGYKLAKPIRITIRRIGCEDFEAEFREANIAISGIDWRDAHHALLTEILDTFEMLLDEQNLCPPASEQLQVLRTYIERA